MFLLLSFKQQQKLKYFVKLPNLIFYGRFLTWNFESTQNFCFPNSVEQNALDSTPMLFYFSIITVVIFMVVKKVKMLLQNSPAQMSIHFLKRLFSFGWRWGEVHTPSLLPGHRGISFHNFLWENMILISKKFRMDSVLWGLTVQLVLGCVHNWCSQANLKK